MSSLHVVLGAGGIGKQVALRLADRGEKVRVLSRSGTTVGDGIDAVATDVLNFNEFAEAVAGASVIYHCIGAPYAKWSGMFPTIMNNVVLAASNLGPKTKVVYADNLYAHGKAGAELGPLREGQNLLAQGKKGALRRDLAEILLDAHRLGQLTAAIGAGSDYFGPDAPSSLLHYFVFPKAIAGQKVSLFADLDARHSFIYTPDFAEGLVRLGTSDTGNGRTWYLPHLPAERYRTFLSRVMAICDGAIDATSDKTPDPAAYRDRMGTSPKAMLALAGLFSKDIREVREVAYQSYVDWVVDSSDYEAAFDHHATPINQALAKTIAWYKARS